MTNDEYEMFFEETFLNLDRELKMSSHSIYIKPNIPLKKIAGATGNYANDIEPEEILVLIDDTVFGGAKEGMIITPYEVMGKEKFEDAICISHDKIEAVGFPKKRKLYINGVKHITFTQPDHKALVNVAKNLEIAIARAKAAFSDDSSHIKDEITEPTETVTQDALGKNIAQNSTINKVEEELRKAEEVNDTIANSYQSNEAIDEKRLANESVISTSSIDTEEEPKNKEIEASGINEKANLKLKVLSNDSIYPVVKKLYRLEQVNRGISMYFGDSPNPYKTFGEILVKSCHKAVVKFRDIMIDKAECKEMANNSATLEVLCHFASISILKLKTEGVPDKFIEQVLVNNIYEAFLMKPTDRNSEMWANIMEVIGSYLKAYEKSGDCVNMELFIVRLVGCNISGKFETDLKKIIAVTYPGGQNAGEEILYITNKFDEYFYKYHQLVESEANSLVDSAFRVLNRCNTPERSSKNWDF